MIYGARHHESVRLLVIWRVTGTKALLASAAAKVLPVMWMREIGSKFREVRFS
jgi:hypothetical protein